MDDFLAGLEHADGGEQHLGLDHACMQPDLAM